LQRFWNAECGFWISFRIPHSAIGIPQSAIGISRRNRTIVPENYPGFLKEPARIADSEVCRHDGKEAKRMGCDATGRRQGRVSGHGGDSPSNPTTVKLTIHLP